MVKAWDSSDETTNYDDFSPLTNPDFYKVKNVYRKWALNETGFYSDPLYNQGDAFDFSKIFGTDSFIHRPRRFLPALTTDNQNNSLGYFLQTSYDNGATWRQYLFAFDILLNECGIWLSCDQLDVDTWIGLLKGTLKFRITASVTSDERLSCEVADGPVNSVIPVVDHVITLPSRFRYRKVSQQSIFCNSTDSSLGQTDEADDSTLLYEYMRKRAGTSSEIIETVDLQTLYPALYCWPGDRIKTSPDSRDFLGLKTDSRSTGYIKHVKIDFKNQCTKLKIIRKRNILL